VFLVDTNVWLERLLGQKQSEEVGRFLGRRPSNELFITDFIFHSIGIILTRLQKRAVFQQFVRDLFVEGGVSLLRLEPADMDTVLQTMDSFRLDFDDAYQYVAAEKYDLTLVSLDSDFDRTLRSRKSPAQA